MQTFATTTTRRPGRAPVAAEIDALRRPQTCGWIAINRPDSAKACSAMVARRAASFTGKALMYKEMLTLVDPRPTAVEKNPIAAAATAYTLACCTSPPNVK